MAMNTDFVVGEINETLVKAGVPGILLSVLQNGEQLNFCAGVRMNGKIELINNNSRFPLGCLIKPIIAMCVAKDIQKGLYSLDDDISELLPELRYPDGRKSGVHIRHLLMHSAGFIEPTMAARWHYGWDSYVEFFRSRTQRFSPGDITSYCQTGAVILTHIIERVWGRPFMQVLQANVLDPVGVDLQREMPGEEVSLHVWNERLKKALPIPKIVDQGVMRRAISDFAVSGGDLIKIFRAVPVAGVSYHVGKEIGGLMLADSRGSPFQHVGRAAEILPDRYYIGFGGYGELFGHTGSYLGTTSMILSDKMGETIVSVGLNTWNFRARDRIAHGLMSIMTGHNGNSRYLDGLGTRHIIGPLKCGHYRPLMMGGGEIDIMADGTVRTARLGVSAKLSPISDGWKIQFIHPEFQIGTSKIEASGELILWSGLSAYILE